MTSLQFSVAVAVCALTPITGHACCALGRAGEPVVNADQTVLLIWDPATKTEHFIRKASFKAKGDDFGFLVPTPSRPDLAESGNAAFPYLANMTTPRITSGGGFGCSAASPGYAPARNAVTVIERKEVAGFDAAVLSASSATALTGWLKTNGYHFSPQVETWAAPYIRDGWMLTALRIVKHSESRSAAAVHSSALRITFRTERPLFPYREPESDEASKKVGAASRLLRLYFISDARYDGGLDGANSWSGKAVWSNAVAPVDKEALLRHLKLPATSGPAKWWLTEFEDRWPYRVAPGDLYFARSGLQKPIARGAFAAQGPGMDLSLPLGFAAAGLVLLRRPGRAFHRNSISA